ncbi:hypothetical protein [Microbacterium sp. NPDC055357]
MSIIDSTEVNPRPAKRTAAPPEDWTWAIEPGDTVDAVAVRASALKVDLTFLIDFDHTREALATGELPEWAHTFEAVEATKDSSPEIWLDGDYGPVNIGISLVYGRYCRGTSRGISVAIDGHPLGEMTSQQLRALATNVEHAADAIDRSTS